MKQIIRLTENQLYNLIEKATKRIIESDEFNYYDDAKGAREYAKAIKMPPGYDKGFNRDVNAGRNSREVERLLNLNGGDTYGSKELKKAQKKYDNYELDNEIADFESKSSPQDYEFSDDFNKMRNKSDDWYGSLEKINDDNWGKIKANESKKNKKKAIRLTESQFYNLIENTIKKVMEGDEDDTISIDEEKITFDGDEDDDEVRFEPIKKFQKGPRKMKKEVRKINDDFKKLTLKENQYLGSCVEVGDDNSCNYINDIFSDATEMAYYVGDPDNDDFGQSEEITQDEFFKNVERSIVENKQLKGKVGFYYIPDLKIYYIYNFDDGIHYFYK